jgi:hypothetical protein
MVYFEDMQNVRKFRSAVRERVQPGTKDYVLGNTTSNGPVCFVLEVAASGDNRGYN